ncbi:MAG: DUF2628 domain-containing protein [Halomonadaceae bacterium]|nr:MAG: DUF2628 domain-containing protein [Halomonadaceae bacterium]
MEDLTTDTPNPTRAKLSKKWQHRFAIFDQFATREGSFFSDGSSEAFKALPRKERSQASLMVLPIFFGPFYYFAKTMWQKGVVLIGLMFLFAVVLELVEYAFDITVPNSVAGLPLGFLCGTLAGYDYYKHVQYGEKMWPIMPGFLSHPVGVVAFPLVAFFIFMGTVSFTDPWLSEADLEEMNASAVHSVSGLWVDEDSNLVAVSLDQGGGTLHTPVDLFMVSISDIVWGEDAVSVVLEAQDSDAAWVLEQDYEVEGMFMELHDSASGKTFQLKFVEELGASK